LAQCLNQKITVLVDGEIAQPNIIQDVEIQKELIVPISCAKLIQAVEFNQIIFLKFTIGKVRNHA